MKPSTFIILAILLCLLLAGGAYSWATGLMDSLFAFRSPLNAQPPVPGPALYPADTPPPAGRVVFVLIDALREDTALRPEIMPFFNQLRAQGAYARMHSRPPSFSTPGYSVLFSGAWPELNGGPVMNVDYEALTPWPQDNLFSAAQRQGLQTAVAGYYWFSKLIPAGIVAESFYTPDEDQSADRQVVDAALPWLRDGRYPFVLVHLDQVDYAGHHEGGPRGLGWEAAARRADALLAEIVAELDLTRDTLLVCSDHGQIDAGGHGGQDRVALIEPFLLVGAAIRPGEYADVQMVDVAPTLAALLGTNLPAAGQGRPLDEMLLLAPEHQKALKMGLEAQQRGLWESYRAALGAAPDLSADVLAAGKLAQGGGPLEVFQAAIEALREQRLNSERLPRGLLAALVGLLPPLAAALAFRRQPGRESEARGATRVQPRLWPWLLAGGGLYLLLFNLGYAVLAGRTYSFSSVGGDMDLILTSAANVVLGLLPAWLLCLFGLGLYHRSAVQAAAASLVLTLTVAWLLALPALLSYVLNGPSVTWALPEFNTLFVGLLALIQLLFVALLGPLLAGLAALATRVAPRSGRAQPSN